MNVSIKPDAVVAYSISPSDYRNTTPYTVSALAKLEEKTRVSSSRPTLGVACFPPVKPGPSDVPIFVSMLYAMAPYDVPREIVVFKADTVEYAKPLIDVGAIKIADLSGAAGWQHCVFEHGDIEMGRERIVKTMHTVFTYRGELTERNISNLAMKSWTQLTEEIDWYLRGTTNRHSFKQRSRLADNILLMSYGLEKELPLDKEHLLPLCDFRLNVEGDDPSRFSAYRYKSAQTGRIADVYEIFKTYCEENSIRPYIHKAGFAANKEEMARIDEMTGVKSAMEAYYSGTPVTYILAGMMR